MWVSDNFKFGIDTKIDRFSITTRLNLRSGDICITKWPERLSISRITTRRYGKLINISHVNDSLMMISLICVSTRRVNGKKPIFVRQKLELLKQKQDYRLQLYETWKWLFTLKKEKFLKRKLCFNSKGNFFASSIRWTSWNKKQALLT